jgi:hypothetical protein
VGNINGNPSDSMQPGLVAHYFRDPIEWDGNWKPRTVPTVSSKDWTFRQYEYSRTEPVNHLFVRRGWFSVRWVGYLQLIPGAPGSTPNGNNGVGNGPDPQPPGNPPPNDQGGATPGNPGNQGGTPNGNNGVDNGEDPQPPGNPAPNDQNGATPGNPGNQGGGNGNGNTTHGNNGVGNGIDPQPPGNPPTNDGPGTGPGNPGNKKARKVRL